MTRMLQGTEMKSLEPKENAMNIYKTAKGFTVDKEGLYTWLMHYDHEGNYVSQSQEDMLGEEGGLITFYPEIIGGIPCVNGKPVSPLTKEEMELAG